MNTNEEGGKRRGVAEARDRIAFGGALGRQVPWFRFSAELRRSLRGTQTDPERDERDIAAACAWQLERVLAWVEHFTRTSPQQKEAPELSDVWYAREMRNGAESVRRLLEQARQHEPSPANNEVALAFAAMELGALLREFEANRHSIVARGQKSLDGSSAGGKNKQPVCRRKSCNGNFVSLCGHPPWQEEVMTQFLAARSDELSLTKATFARRIKKKLDLTLSERTILNFLSSQTSEE